MIDAIDWPTPAEKKPAQMQEIVVEDTFGRLRMCKYMSIELTNEIVEFYMLQEPHETEIPPERVVRWQPIVRSESSSRPVHLSNEPYAGPGNISPGPFSESEFYDLYELHRNDVIGALEETE